MLAVAAALAICGGAFGFVGAVVWIWRRDAPPPSLSTGWALFAAPALAAALIVWRLVGNASEEGGYVQLLPLPQSELAAWVAGAAGVLIAVGVIATIGTMHPRGVFTRDGCELLLAGVLLGAFVGFCGRVLSASTAGANIGGGLLMLFGPVLIVPTLVFAWIRLQRVRRGLSEGGSAR